MLQNPVESIVTGEHQHWPRWIMEKVGMAQSVCMTGAQAKQHGRPIVLRSKCRVAFKLRYWEVRGQDHELAGSDTSSPWLRERTIDDAGMLHTDPDIAIALVVDQPQSSSHT